MCADIRKRLGGDQQLVERLLMNVLIEARSCERFKILSQRIEDEELKNFYYELLVSEAGHYKNFISLTKHYVPDRWKEFLTKEAKIIQSLEVRGDRIH